MELQSSAAVRASKRLRFSPSFQKVCVVLRCWHPDGDEYKFYIVDLDSSSGGGSDEYTHKEPNIRFKGSDPPVAFCALNSTLYMFEGDKLEGFGQRTFAGKFHISPDIHDFKLEKQKLDRVNEMHHAKIDPIALPTPDGNHILVFSSEIIKGHGHLFFGDSFELYNVANDSWEDLPPLVSSPLVSSRGGSRLGSFVIKAYGFPTDSLFVIVIEIESSLYSLDLYSLDLNAQTKVWKEFGGDPPNDGYYIGIQDYGFYFTPHFAYARFNDGVSGQFPIPVSKFPDYDSLRTDLDYSEVIFPYITLLGHNEDGVFDMGIVQAQFHPDHPNAKNLRVILDIYQTDTEQFKRIMEQHTFREQLGRVTKTFKLMIDCDLSTYFCGEMYLFSI